MWVFLKNKTDMKENYKEKYSSMINEGLNSYENETKELCPLGDFLLVF